MMTYIVQIDGPQPFVKFGRTKSIKSRISTLSTGIPWDLHVVCLFGVDCERDLKKRFKSDHFKKEWYRPTNQLLEFLNEAASDGRLVKQVDVDQRYINAVIKPRIKEYLAGREPNNNDKGDLVRCIMGDMLPSLSGREAQLVAATKGHVTDALARGFAPTQEKPRLSAWPEAVKDAAA